MRESRHARIEIAERHEEFIELRKLQNYELNVIQPNSRTVGLHLVGSDHEPFKWMKRAGIGTTFRILFDNRSRCHGRINTTRSENRIRRHLVAAQDIRNCLAPELIRIFDK